MRKINNKANQNKPSMLFVPLVFKVMSTPIGHFVKRCHDEETDSER